MIPVNEPLLDGNERKYLCECIDTAFISSEGPFVQHFENQFSSFLGLKHGVAVCNGTAALEAALYGLGLQPDDEVILPAFTIISCVTAILRLGGKPVLVDIDPQTWTMDVSQVEAKITSRTKVVMAVHIYGHSVDMDPLLALREKHGFRILEDAAEVHGAEYLSKRLGGWVKCGAIGDAAATSFYANKIITTGEGGMIVSNDDTIAERVKSYRNLCFRPEERFHHTEMGYNFRMTNLQAAIGVAQMEQIERFISIKRKFGAAYTEQIATIPGVRFMPIQPWAKSVYWMYSLEMDPSLGLDAKTVMGRLGKMGIGTRPFFKGLHAQPVMHDMGLFQGESYPRTDHAYRYGFYLPSGMALTEAQVQESCDKLRLALQG